MKIIELDDVLETKLVNYKIIGVDESGVGDYFGPLCAAAVFIPRANYQKILELGVRDSKQIADKKILEIAPKIKKLTLYGLAHLNPIGYNKLHLNGYNANELKMFIHLKAINQVENKIEQEYDFSLIDQYSTLKTIAKYYMKYISSKNNWTDLKPLKRDMYITPKAENKSLEVAAASILARELYLNKMQEMNEKYSVVFPLGASNKVKEFAKEFFEKNNDVDKKELVKESFKM